RVLKVVRREGCAPPPPPRRGAGERRLRPLPGPLAAARPVLPLDEPLSNLDARLRDEMREEIRRLHQETRLTMVYVTHDQKEALALADRLAVMNKGRLIQVGTPADLYHRPANRFVAGFLGDATFIPGKIRTLDASGCPIESPLGNLLATTAQTMAVGSPVLCTIRPQAWSVKAPSAKATTNAAASNVNGIAGTIEQLTFLGEMTQ